MIEGLRTDQLILFGTGLPVSQALSLILIIVAAANLVYHHRKLQRETKGEAQHGNFERGTERKD